jgi:hypothetical protein
MAIFALNIWYRTVGDDRDYYGEKVVDLMDGQAVFPGQQDGERILYVIRVHPLLLVFRLLRGVILFALFCAAWYRGGSVITAATPGVYRLGWWGGRTRASGRRLVEC